ncbi:MAG: type IV pilus assembly protein PilM [bacterium]
MGFLSTTESSFGLDISQRDIRLVQLAKHGKKVDIQLYSELHLPVGCLEAGEIKNPKVFLESLKKLMHTKHGRGHLSDEVITVLPEQKTFMKIFDLPKENISVREQIVKILPQHLPFDPESMYFDFQVIKREPTRRTVLVGACAKTIVNSYFEILNQAGLSVVAMEIEASVIDRLLIEYNDEKDPQIIIDFGANRSGLFLYDQGSIKFTVSLPVSGIKTDQLIASTLSLDLEKAEQAKIACGMDPAKANGAICDILNKIVEEVAVSVTQAINFYDNNFPEHQRPAKIVLCGGGANMYNINQTLQNKIGLPTIISDPWKNIKNPNPSYFTPQKSQSFVTAMGLALRGANLEKYL